MSDLWILAGQSNMEGYGKMRDVESPSPNIRSFAHGDCWKIAEEQLHWLPDALDDVHHPGIVDEALEKARSKYRLERKTGSGLGLTFEKAVSERVGIDIDLLPVAQGGTTMSQWSSELKHLGGRSLFGAMLRRTRLALDSGGEIRLRGLLWYQGESDANPEFSPYYLDKMVKFIDDVRAELSYPQLPFFLVQLGCWNNDMLGGDPFSISWDTVRNAQRMIPDIVPHTAVVPAIDLELEDGIHIGTEGLKRLGRRLANVAVNRVYGRQAPTGPKLKSVTKGDGFIRVSYDGVSRMLITPDPAGRVSGYSLSFGDNMPTTNPIYRSYVDPENPSDVLLFVEQPITSDLKLYYGEGVFPFCQLADASDMAAVAFGPVDIH